MSDEYEDHVTVVKCVEITHARPEPRSLIEMLVGEREDDGE